MGNIYDAPDNIRLTATITNAAGAATDPSAAVLVVKKPNAAYVGYGTSFGWSDQGAWDASTNTPALADGTGTDGHYYTSSAAGSVDFGNGSISFVVNDRVFYNGSSWRRWHSPSATTLTKSATGVYYVDQFIGQSGKWYYYHEGVTETGGSEVNFDVQINQF